MKEVISPERIAFNINAFSAGDPVANIYLHAFIL